MNILILTGKFGMGHWSASQSLRQELLCAEPTAEVIVEDFPSFALPNFSSAIYRGFDFMVTYASHLFNTYYRLTELGSPDAHPMFERLMLDKMVELLALRQPDMVIATHPLCAQVVSRLKETESLQLPLVTCITDVTTHPEWINGGTDCYLVPSEDIRLALHAKGVPTSQILVTGIPVRQEFHHLAHRRGGAVRRLLLMGGGLGLLPKNDNFYASLAALPNVHVTVITGKNEKLREHLSEQFPTIEVLGFTDRVSEYMAQADLIVSKPGGITLFESIFSQLPILTWPPQLQQERNNARWLTHSGIGWVAEHMDCAEEIAALILDDDALRSAGENMGRMRHSLETQSLRQLVLAISGRMEVCA